MAEAEKKRILLIDDEPNLVRTVSDYLNYRGFQVDVAKSGEEGLKKLEHSDPDLIILDIAMPGIGGIGFLKEITTVEGKPSHPVLVLTARSAMQDFFSEIDIEGFIAKPCTEGDIENELRSAIARAESEKEAAAKPMKERVLLGEDNDSTAAQITDVLVSAGYEVETVGSGPEVLERAPGLGPGVIVMKEFLRSMNGTNVAPILRLMPATKHTPVVLYGFSPDSAAAWASLGGLPPGVDGYARVSDGSAVLAAIEDVLR